MRFTLGTTGNGPSPYRGLFWTLTFTVAIVVLYLALRHSAARESARSNQPLTSQEKEQMPTTSEKAEAKPKEIPGYLNDPTMLRDMVKSEVMADHAFYYLLYQMKIADLAKLAAEAKPAPVPGEIGKLKPGTPITLSGTVRSMRLREDLCIPEAEIKGAVEYEIEDAHGNLYLVFAVHDVTGIDRGDRVKLAGRFLKLYPYAASRMTRPVDAPAGPNVEDQPPPSGEPIPPAADPAPNVNSESKPTPVIVAWGLEAPEYLADGAVLDKVEDGTFGQEPKAFYYLVHEAQVLTDRQLTERVDPKLTPGLVSRNPAAARGRLITAVGTLKEARLRNELPNIAGVKQLYRCILRARDGQWVWVYALEAPAGLKDGDNVAATGVFFKSYRYVSRKQEEQIALLMMTRRLTRVEYQEPMYFEWIIPTLAGVLALVLVIALLIERRQVRQMDRRVRDLAHKARPANLNSIARDVAARTREARNGDQPPDPTPPQSPGASPPSSSI